MEEVMMNEWAYNMINNTEKCGVSKSEFERAIDTDLAYNIINRYKIQGRAFILPQPKIR